jgi:dipeptidyl aminopeptidase/acylaminoacyl peptidase
MTQFTKHTYAEVYPRFTHDGKRISFTSNGNLFVMSLDNGLLVQLTDIRAAAPATSAAPAAGGAGRGFGGRGQGGGGRGAVAPVTGDAPTPEPRGTESQEYLKKEQKELLQVVRDRVAQREEQQKKRTAETAAVRKPFTLQARQTAAGLQLSPDEKYVIASVFETATTPARNTIVPNYITDSVYTEDIPGRSNVGDSQGASRLAILNVETGEVKWVDHGQKKAPTPAPPERDIQMSAPLWSEDGTKAVISARSADNKDRWLFALDPATGKTRTLVNIHDDAWVGGPQGAANTLGWMKNDREVYFISEKTGYAQLYAVPFDSGEPRALTSGNWEVLNVRQSRQIKFYLIAAAEPPSDQSLYETPGDGCPLTRISKAPGKHTAFFSPDERFIADVYSYSNKPPDLYVQENRPQQDLKRLTTSPSADFAQYPWQDPPIVMVPARDGVKVPARLYKPANYRKGGPAVVFVHGSGYLQNVDHKWSPPTVPVPSSVTGRGYLVLDVITAVPPLRP